MRALLLSLALAIPAQSQAQACATALMLTMDVSNSVDVAEYRLQTDGLADALRDPEIVETLVRDRIAIAVMQWAGEDAQQVSIPWVRIRSTLDVAILSDRARALPRAFDLSNTAPAEIIDAAMAQFAAVPDCARRVIDISGDGPANAGGDVARARDRAQRAGVTINGIAIEENGRGQAVTNYYRGTLITRDGFVMTARAHRDYPRAIREKILREISRILG